MDPDNVFNTKGFLRHVDEDAKQLMKAICRTQLFSHFIHDAYEYDDNYEVRVFTETMKLREELKEYTDNYVIEMLSPKMWKTRHVEVMPCDLRGLPNG